MKSLLYLGFIIGSTVGGWVPSLFGAGLLSIWSILGSLIGGIAGGYIGYYYSD